MTNVLQQKYSLDEIGRIGEEVYHRDIRPQVMPQHKGEFLALDIETGDYEVGPDDLQNEKRLRARRPDGVLYGVRVGYTSAYTLGGRMIEDGPMMTGIVNAVLEATLPLEIHGPTSQAIETIVIDTGYNGAFTLPLAIVTALALPQRMPHIVTLGDGSRRSLPYYEADVMWGRAAADYSCPLRGR